jgi:DNA-binding Xre family transcriptional regulator
MDQLAEVLAMPKEQVRDLFIGGSADTQSNTLALVRGDFSRVCVPLSIFQPSGTSKPDFRRFGVDDYGQTVRLGNYEAGTDFILYALDPEYRTRINAKRREQKQSFGASLRRLRNLRKLSRDSFGVVAAKTIARIEGGEVKKPHRTTLQAICETLSVELNEIETY